MADDSSGPSNSVPPGGGSASVPPGRRTSLRPEAIAQSLYGTLHVEELLLYSIVLGF